jgi:hypothetical protein
MEKKSIYSHIKISTSYSSTHRFTRRCPLCQPLPSLPSSSRSCLDRCAAVVVAAVIVCFFVIAVVTVVVAQPSSLSRNRLRHAAVVVDAVVIAQPSLSLRSRRCRCCHGVVVERLSTSSLLSSSRGCRPCSRRLVAVGIGASLPSPPSPVLTRLPLSHSA